MAQANVSVDLPLFTGQCPGMRPADSFVELGGISRCLGWWVRLFLSRGKGEREATSGAFFFFSSSIHPIPGLRLDVTRAGRICGPGRNRMALRSRFS